MAETKETRKIRGVFERPKGSQIWWISYFAHGKHHRERVGKKSDAITLYQVRKTQIFQGKKLPELNRKRVTLGELMDLAVAYAREHNRSFRQYELKAELLRGVFGARSAEDVRPDEFAAWIRKRNVAPATFNRYRAFLSLCYREGMRYGRVTSNPLQMLTQKKEPRGRKRFLSREEYSAVLAALHQHHPKRVAEFVISVQTGMRLSEQFGLRWCNIDFARREIDLSRTKNEEPRTIPMTTVVFEELESLKAKANKPRASDLVFSRPLKGQGAVQPRWFTKLLRGDPLEISDYTWHNNRHTFCSWLAIAGTPLRTIQELAGHKTIAITARYAHLSPDHKRTEIERLVEAPTPKLMEFPTSTKTSTG